MEENSNQHIKTESSITKDKIPEDALDLDQMDNMPVDDDHEIIEKSPSGRFSRFRKKLGSGSFKIVYLGFDSETGREIAWNVMSTAQMDTTAKRRVMDEINIAKTLNHKRIIAFVSAWINRQDQQVVFITERVTGGSLRQYISRLREPLKARVVKDWCRQILEGLVYLHSMSPRAIIHRDLKCDNIFINGHNGEILLGDLGLSTYLRNTAASIVGTPEFMAPELYDEKYGTSVDIYAFGMCVLEMVTRKFPYEECKTPAQIYKKVLTGERPAVLYRIGRKDIRALIESCIEPNPAERPSAEQLLGHPFLTTSDVHLDSERIELLPVAVAAAAAAADWSVLQKKQQHLLHQQLQSCIKSDNDNNHNVSTDVISTNNALVNINTNNEQTNIQTHTQQVYNQTDEIHTGRMHKIGSDGAILTSQPSFADLSTLKPLTIGDNVSSNPSLLNSGLAINNTESKDINSVNNSALMLMMQQLNNVSSSNATSNNYALFNMMQHPPSVHFDNNNNNSNTISNMSNIPTNNNTPNVISSQLQNIATPLFSPSNGVAMLQHAFVNTSLLVHNNNHNNNTYNNNNNQQSILGGAPSITSTVSQNLNQNSSSVNNNNNNISQQAIQNPLIQTHTTNQHVEYDQTLIRGVSTSSVASAPPPVSHLPSLPPPAPSGDGTSSLLSRLLSSVSPDELASLGNIPSFILPPVDSVPQSHQATEPEPILTFDALSSNLNSNIPHTVSSWSLPLTADISVAYPVIPLPPQSSLQSIGVSESAEDTTSTTKNNNNNNYSVIEDENHAENAIMPSASNLVGASNSTVLHQLTSPSFNSNSHPNITIPPKTASNLMASNASHPTLLKSPTVLPPSVPFPPANSSLAASILAGCSVSTAVNPALDSMASAACNNNGTTTTTQNHNLTTAPVAFTPVQTLTPTLSSSSLHQHALHAHNNHLNATSSSISQSMHHLPSPTTTSAHPALVSTNTPVSAVSASIQHPAPTPSPLPPPVLSPSVSANLIVSNFMPNSTCQNNINPSVSSVPPPSVAVILPDIPPAPPANIPPLMRSNTVNLGSQFYNSNLQMDFSSGNSNNVNPIILPPHSKSDFDLLRMLSSSSSAHLPLTHNMGHASNTAKPTQNNNLLYQQQQQQQQLVGFFNQSGGSESATNLNQMNINNNAAYHHHHQQNPSSIPGPSGSSIHSAAGMGLAAHQMSISSRSMPEITSNLLAGDEKLIEHLRMQIMQQHSIIMQLEHQKQLQHQMHQHPSNNPNTNSNIQSQLQQQQVSHFLPTTSSPSPVQQQQPQSFSKNPSSSHTYHPPPPPSRIKSRPLLASIRRSSSISSAGGSVDAAATGGADQIIFDKSPHRGRRRNVSQSVSSAERRSYSNVSSSSHGHKFLSEGSTATRNNHHHSLGRYGGEGYQTLNRGKQQFKSKHHHPQGYSDNKYEGAGEYAYKNQYDHQRRCNAHRTEDDIDDEVSHSCSNSVDNDDRISENNDDRHFNRNRNHNMNNIRSARENSYGMNFSNGKYNKNNSSSHDIRVINKHCRYNDDYDQISDDITDDNHPSHQRHHRHVINDNNRDADSELDNSCLDYSAVDSEYSYNNESHINHPNKLNNKRKPNFHQQQSHQYVHIKSSLQNNNNKHDIKNMKSLHLHDQSQSSTPGAESLSANRKKSSQKQNHFSANGGSKASVSPSSVHHQNQQHLKLNEKNKMDAVASTSPPISGNMSSNAVVSSANLPIVVASSSKQIEKSKSSNIANANDIRLDRALSDANHAPNINITSNHHNQQLFNLIDHHDNIDSTLQNHDHLGPSDKHDEEHNYLPEINHSDTNASMGSQVRSNLDATLIPSRHHHSGIRRGSQLSIDDTAAPLTIHKTKNTPSQLLNVTSKRHHHSENDFANESDHLPPGKDFIHSSTTKKPLGLKRNNHHNGLSDDSMHHGDGGSGRGRSPPISTRDQSSSGSEHNHYKSKVKEIIKSVPSSASLKKSTPFSDKDNSNVGVDEVENGVPKKKQQFKQRRSSLNEESAITHHHHQLHLAPMANLFYGGRDVSGSKLGVDIRRSSHSSRQSSSSHSPPHSPSSHHHHYLTTLNQHQHVDNLSISNLVQSSLSHLGTPGLNSNFPGNSKTAYSSLSRIENKDGKPASGISPSNPANNANHIQFITSPHADNNNSSSNTHPVDISAGEFATLTLLPAKRSLVGVGSPYESAQIISSAEPVSRSHSETGQEHHAGVRVDGVVSRSPRSPSITRTVDSSRHERSPSQHGSQVSSRNHRAHHYQTHNGNKRHEAHANRNQQLNSMGAGQYNGRRKSVSGSQVDDDNEMMHHHHQSRNNHKDKTHVSRKGNKKVEDEDHYIAQSPSSRYSELHSSSNSRYGYHNKNASISMVASNKKYGMSMGGATTLNNSNTAPNNYPSSKTNHSKGYSAKGKSSKHSRKVKSSAHYQQQNNNDKHGSTCSETSSSFSSDTWSSSLFPLDNLETISLSVFDEIVKQRHSHRHQHHATESSHDGSNSRHHHRGDSEDDSVSSISGISGVSLDSDFEVFVNQKIIRDIQISVFHPDGASTLIAFDFRIGTDTPQSVAASIFSGFVPKAKCAAMLQQHILEMNNKHNLLHQQQQQTSSSSVPLSNIATTSLQQSHISETPSTVSTSVVAIAPEYLVNTIKHEIAARMMIMRACRFHYNVSGGVIPKLFADVDSQVSVSDSTSSSCSSDNPHYKAKRKQHHQQQPSAEFSSASSDFSSPPHKKRHHHHRRNLPVQVDKDNSSSSSSHSYHQKQSKQHAQTSKKVKENINELSSTLNNNNPSTLLPNSVSKKNPPNSAPPLQVSTDSKKIPLSAIVEVASKHTDESHTINNATPASIPISSHKGSKSAMHTSKLPIKMSTARKETVANVNQSHSPESFEDDSFAHLARLRKTNASTSSSVRSSFEHRRLKNCVVLTRSDNGSNEEEQSDCASSAKRRRIPRKLKKKKKKLSSDKELETNILQKKKSTQRGKQMEDENDDDDDDDHAVVDATKVKKSKKLKNKDNKKSEEDKQPTQKIRSKVDKENLISEQRQSQKQQDNLKVTKKSSAALDLHPPVRSPVDPLPSAGHVRKSSKEIPTASKSSKSNVKNSKEALKRTTKHVSKTNENLKKSKKSKDDNASSHCDGSSSIISAHSYQDSSSSDENSNLKENNNTEVIARNLSESSDDSSSYTSSSEEEISESVSYSLYSSSFFSSSSSSENSPHLSDSSSPSSSSKSCHEAARKKRYTSPLHRVARSKRSSSSSSFEEGGNINTDQNVTDDHEQVGDVIKGVSEGGVRISQKQKQQFLLLDMNDDDENKFSQASEKKTNLAQRQHKESKMPNGPLNPLSGAVMSHSASNDEDENQQQENKKTDKLQKKNGDKNNIFDKNHFKDAVKEKKKRKAINVNENNEIPSKILSNSKPSPNYNTSKNESPTLESKKLQPLTTSQTINELKKNSESEKSVSNMDDSKRKQKKKTTLILGYDKADNSNTVIGFQPYTVPPSDLDLCDKNLSKGIINNESDIDEIDSCINNDEQNDSMNSNNNASDSGFSENDEDDDDEEEFTSSSYGSDPPLLSIKPAKFKLSQKQTLESNDTIVLSRKSSKTFSKNSPVQDYKTDESSRIYKRSSSKQVSRVSKHKAEEPGRSSRKRKVEISQDNLHEAAVATHSSNILTASSSTNMNSTTTTNNNSHKCPNDLLILSSGVSPSSSSRVVRASKSDTDIVTSGEEVFKDSFSNTMDKNKIIVYAPSSIAACASQSQHLDLLCSGFDVHDITTSSAFPYSPAANHQIHPDSTSAVSDALSHPLVHTASRPPSYLPTAGSSTSNPHAASKTHSTGGGFGALLTDTGVFTAASFFVAPVPHSASKRGQVGEEGTTQTEKIVQRGKRQSKNGVASGKSDIRNDGEPESLSKASKSKKKKGGILQSALLDSLSSELGESENESRNNNLSKLAAVGLKQTVSSDIEPPPIKHHSKRLHRVSHSRSISHRSHSSGRSNHSASPRVRNKYTTQRELFSDKDSDRLIVERSLNSSSLRSIELDKHEKKRQRDSRNRTRNYMQRHRRSEDNSESTSRSNSSSSSALRRSSSYSPSDLSEQDLPTRNSKDKKTHFRENSKNVSSIVQLSSSKAKPTKSKISPSQQTKNSKASAGVKGLDTSQNSKQQNQQPNSLQPPQIQDSHPKVLLTLSPIRVASSPVANLDATDLTPSPAISQPLTPFENTFAIPLNPFASSCAIVSHTLPSAATSHNSAILLCPCEPTWTSAAKAFAATLPEVSDSICNSALLDNEEYESLRSTSSSLSPPDANFLPSLAAKVRTFIPSSCDVSASDLLLAHQDTFICDNPLLALTPVCEPAVSPIVSLVSALVLLQRCLFILLPSENRIPISFGVFDAATIQWVKAFQASRDLEVTGTIASVSDWSSLVECAVLKYLKLLQKTEHKKCLAEKMKISKEAMRKEASLVIDARERSFENSILSNIGQFSGIHSVGSSALMLCSQSYVPSTSLLQNQNSPLLHSSGLHLDHSSHSMTNDNLNIGAIYPNPIVIFSQGSTSAPLLKQANIHERNQSFNISSSSHDLQQQTAPVAFVQGLQFSDSRTNSDDQPL